jgi:hypothetical protein
MIRLRAAVHYTRTSELHRGSGDEEIRAATTTQQLDDIERPTLSEAFAAAGAHAVRIVRDVRLATGDTFSLTMAIAEGEVS